MKCTTSKIDENNKSVEQSDESINNIKVLYKKPQSIGATDYELNVDKVILYLLENHDKSVRSFFKGDEASYERFIRKYSIKEIYKEVKRQNQIKRDLKLKQYENEMLDVDVKRHYDNSSSILFNTINKIKNKTPSFYDTRGSIKIQVMLLNVLLKIISRK